MHHPPTPLLTLSLTTLLTVASLAQNADGPRHQYTPGFRTPRQLGIEIVKNLTPAQRDALAPDPVLVEYDDKPFIVNRSVIDPSDSKPRGVVSLSMGFIDLVNNLAHARAIDHIQKGYFQTYVLSLAQEDGSHGLKELPGIADDKYWAEDVMNEQQTFFNQIAGTTIAIKLAHHYLGQFQRYVPQMFAGGDQSTPQRVRLNNLLTADEWAAAIKAGTRNALDSIASVEGIQLLLEAIEKMPRRPEWTSCFVPDKDLVKLSKLRKDLKKIEDDFFSGK